MGLLAASITKQRLIAYRADLEEKKLAVLNARMSLTSAGNDLLTVGNDMDPESPVVKQLEERKERLAALEKKLDMQLEEYETQLKMVEGQIKTCDEMIQSSLKG